MSETTSGVVSLTACVTCVMPYSGNFSKRSKQRLSEFANKKGKQRLSEFANNKYKQRLSEYVKKG